MKLADCIDNACCNQFGHKQDIKNLISELEALVKETYIGKCCKATQEIHEQYFNESSCKARLDEIKEKYGTICS